MGDDELSAIRARRMAELQAQQGGGGGGPQGRPGGQMEAAKKAEEQRSQMEDMKNSILSQVLTQEARARLNTLMLAKPQKGALIEANLIRMAQSGQLGGKLSEEELIGLLERFSDSSALGKASSKVKFDRRRAALDSDSD